jgi:hypothetical protein
MIFGLPINKEGRAYIVGRIWPEHRKKKICMNFMQEWPLKSKLDPKIYGPPESAITTEMIERDIGGYMTVKEVTCK